MIQSIRALIARLSNRSSGQTVDYVVPAADASTEVTPLRLISAAIRADDREAVERLFQAHPELVDYHSLTTPSWLCTAAANGSSEVARWLLAQGMDVNIMDVKGHSCALGFAISNDDLEMVRLLGRHGADPNLGRLMFRAIRRKDAQLGLEMVKALIEMGIDLDRRYAMPGGEHVSAIEFALLHDKPLIVDLLRA